MLTVESLTVGYGESVVLSDVSLSVRKGQVVCVMGRNGVGKTTLLRTIMGILAPRTGRITLHGQDVTALPPHQRARLGIGYVPQGRGIFPHLTVRENLEMGWEAAGDRPPLPLEAALDLFPALRSLMRRPAGVLSGGQQQQLAIAQALASRPHLLLLDEPTEGIQPSVTLEIADTIAALRARGDTGILLVEQFVDFALDLADHVAVLGRGTVVAQGPPEVLDPAAIAEYVAV